MLMLIDVDFDVDTDVDVDSGRLKGRRQELSFVTLEKL
jgi:hypothetical protein